MKTLLFGITVAAALNCAIAETARPDSTAQLAQAPANSAKAFRFGLVGTWRSQVTFVSCVDGTPVSLPFPSVNTYALGNTALEYGVASGNLRGPGLGTWARTGLNEFTSMFVFFRYDASGVQVRDIATVTRTIKLTGPGQYEATNTTEFRNTDGVLLFTGCATEVSNRL